MYQCEMGAFVAKIFFFFCFLKVTIHQATLLPTTVAGNNVASCVIVILPCCVLPATCCHDYTIVLFQATCCQQQLLVTMLPSVCWPLVKVNVWMVWNLYIFFVFFFWDTSTHTQFLTGSHDGRVKATRSVWREGHWTPNRCNNYNSILMGKWLSRTWAEANANANSTNERKVVASWLWLHALNFTCVWMSVSVCIQPIRLYRWFYEFNKLKLPPKIVEKPSQINKRTILLTCL